MLFLNTIVQNAYVFIHFGGYTILPLE